ncbi:hypothetical protein BDP55DRAFT_668709 [Colletotrichum godetiae]|uniref:Uncharacterized protein n=1 Tax=Colletotrichum godetiae TaxID=1209918 RepID=A0AAJ0AIS0_9PEZI|nr:uncharacterized protein BDP55DRAFT_668709 [Colletotrichum godetiae]KAK1673985.1 hypothetical protein BDP55DRAFT_668709 [Colletotrichum godetiae]
MKTADADANPHGRVPGARPERAPPPCLFLDARILARPYLGGMGRAEWLPRG